MMGERRVAQEPLFYEFSLDRHVPAGHLLRGHCQSKCTPPFRSGYRRAEAPTNPMMFCV